MSIYQLMLSFTTGIRLFIRYNEFEEYGYQIVFSRKKYDIARFDNFDDRWPVASSPHHFHPRNNKSVEKSPMIGLPAKDIPILIEFIQNEIY